MRHFPLLVALLLVLSANKCGDATSDASDMKGLMNSMWALKTLGGKPIALPEGAQQPWLKLVPEEDRVEGHGGCNALMGGYSLDGNALSFPGLASTKKFCEGVQPLENGFVQALNATDGFKLDRGLLTLQEGGRELATLERQDP